MKILLFSLSVLAGVSNFPATQFEAGLVNVTYYGKGGCSEDSPILVRVLYSVKGKELKEIRMQHTFSNGVNSTVPVSQVDKKGNVVYEFCARENEVVEFTTRFVTKDGEKSSPIKVNCRTSKEKIINGTPPQILPL